MARVPRNDRHKRERTKRLAHLRKRLAQFEAIAAHRREVEFADEGEAVCRALIAELETGDTETSHR